MNEQQVSPPTMLSEIQPQTSNVQQPAPQQSKENKGNKWLIICLAAFLLITLSVVGVLAYQNYQLNRQLLNQNKTIEPAPTQPILIPTFTPTPTPTASNTTQMTDWRRYQSTIGISFLKPEDAGVAEPNLTADISIESRNNKRENQEIIDGWAIGITYTPKQDFPTSIKNRAEELKSYEEENGGTTTPLTTTSIGGKTAYYFFVTNCLHFSSSLYFISSDSTYYEIRADYIGNVEDYKNVTDKIITSIVFTK